MLKSWRSIRGSTGSIQLDQTKSRRATSTIASSLYYIDSVSQRGPAIRADAAGEGETKQPRATGEFGILRYMRGV